MKYPSRKSGYASPVGSGASRKGVKNIIARKRKGERKRMWNKGGAYTTTATWRRMIFMRRGVSGPLQVVEKMAGDNNRHGTYKGSERGSTARGTDGCSIHVSQDME